jgi:glycosyltransferase involved in cell wall biosynthesis
MKIIEVIPSLYLGGAQTMCLDLCDYLVSSGNEVTLLVFFDGGVERFTKRIENAPYKTIFLHKKRGFSFRFVNKLASVILSLNPDIIHTHLSAIAYICFAKALKRFPVFHTIHNEAGKENNPIYRALLKHRIKQKWNIHLVGISAKIGLGIKEIYKIDPVIINNGISLRKVEDSIPKEYRFVTCGRLGAQKNYTRLIQAFCYYRGKGGTGRLLIIGDGDEKTLLMNKAKELNLESEIVFYGYSCDPLPLVESGSIFVLTSNYEGNPIVILEAMSLGLPILSTNVGGISDVVSNKNAILLPRNSCYQDIGEAMLKIANDSSWLEKASRESRNLILNFTAEKMGQDYLLAFETVLRCRK